MRVGFRRIGRGATAVVVVVWVLPSAPTATTVALVTRAPEGSVATPCSDPFACAIN